MHFGRKRHQTTPNESSSILVSLLSLYGICCRPLKKIQHHQNHHHHYNHRVHQNAHPYQHSRRENDITATSTDALTLHL